jgi:hypothetical protein
MVKLVHEVGSVHNRATYLVVTIRAIHCGRLWYAISSVTQDMMRGTHMVVNVEGVCLFWLLIFIEHLNLSGPRMDTQKTCA